MYRNHLDGEPLSLWCDGKTDSMRKREVDLSATYCHQREEEAEAIYRLVGEAFFYVLSVQGFDYGPELNLLACKKIIVNPQIYQPFLVILVKGQEKIHCQVGGCSVHKYIK